jgi:hypothetical protein
MRERLIRLAGRFYPASWRRRYGIEFEALLEDTSRDWRDVLDVLLGALKMQMTTWTFGKIAAGIGVAGALLCGALSFIALPDQYTSYAVLRLIRLPQATDNSEDFIRALVKNALSRDSLAGVIEKQGLYQRERAKKGMDDAIDRMRHNVRFDRIGHSNVFHVAFRYGDAEQARRAEHEVINKLMAANVTFLRESSRRFNYGLEVLDPASLPKRPSYPNRILITATGLAGGLLFGAVTALIARTRTANPAGNSPKSS